MNMNDLSKKCLNKLKENNKTIAFAESCTGGLVAKLLTDHSGASDVFECGVVCYSGRIKYILLRVSDMTLKQFGEVSAETAKEMAEGIKEVSGADIGVGITGIAGPTGGTPLKPVGLIFVGISSNGITQVYRLEYFDLQLSRTDRRERTAEFVYEKVLELI